MGTNETPSDAKPADDLPVGEYPPPPAWRLPLAAAAWGLWMIFLLWIVWTVRR